MRFKKVFSPEMANTSIFLLLAVLAVAAVGAQAVDALPEQAIEAIPIEPDMLSQVAVTINGDMKGDQELGILGEVPIVSKQLLSELLGSYLAPDVYDTIFNVVLSKLTWVTEADLRLVGIGWEWDMARIVLSLTVPSSYGPTTDIDVTPTYVANIKPILKPAVFSGHIDFSVDSEMDITSTTIDYPTTASASGTFNLLDWVAALTATATVDASGVTASLASSQVLHDFPAIKGRLTLGRLTTPGLSYQSQPELYGFSLKKEDILQYKVKPGFYELFTEFTVETASTVRMILNDMVYRTITLPPGNYRILDLPFAYGVNDFVIEIEDAAGNKKRTTLSIPREMNLLAESTSDYAISAGVGKTESDQPFFSGYYRYGFTPRFTAGLTGQADMRSAMGGVNFVLATRAGSFTGATVGMGAWDGRSSPFGWASSLQYRLSLPSREYFPLLGLSAEYRSPGFVAPTPSATASSGEETLRFSGQLGGKLTSQSSYSLSGTWTRTGGSSDAVSLSAALNRNLGQGSSLSLVGTMNQTIGEAPDFSLSAMLFVLPKDKPGRSWSFIQSGDTSNTVSYLDKLDLLGGLDLSLSGSNLMIGTTDGSNVTTSLKKSFEWADFSLGGAINYGNPTIGSYGSVKASAATTLAFAGRYAAITRQLDDSFAILVPSKELAGQRIYFKTDGGASAESLQGRPVVLPLSSYKAIAAYIELPEAPPDVIPSTQAALLTPSLESGIIYESGVQKRYRVTGKLLSTAGEPYGYIAGDLVDKGGSNLLSTFTDADGSFELYDLEPGSYIIYWPESIGMSKIEVTNTDSGTVDLGVVVPEATDQAGG